MSIASIKRGTIESSGEREESDSLMLKKHWKEQRDERRKTKKGETENENL